MSVALLVASPFPGGAEKSAAELAAALRHRGVPLDVFMPPANPLFRQLAAQGVPVRPLRLAPPVRPALSWDFARFAAGLGGVSRLRRGLSRYDTLIASGDAAMVYAILSRFAGRLIYMVRDVRTAQALREVFFGSADAIVPISRFVEQTLADADAPSAKLRFICNGIDVAWYRQVPAGSEARRRLGLPESQVVVLWLGNICRWKRPAVFIRAAAGLVEKALFLLVGGAHFSADQAYAAEIARRAEERGVRVFPYNEDPRWFYAAASFVMLTSRREPFGRTAVEAMAAGVPLVAARSGAFPEILRDGTSAALVEDTGDLAVDAEALVTAVGTLISEPDRLRGLSEGARLAASDFDVSHTAEALAALL